MGDTALHYLHLLAGPDIHYVIADFLGPAVQFFRQRGGCHKRLVVCRVAASHPDSRDSR